MIKPETNLHVIRNSPRQLSRLRKAGNTAWNNFQFQVIMAYRPSSCFKRFQFLKYKKLCQQKPN
jgi:hypothetical protein